MALPGWKQLVRGGLVLEPGNSVENKTGTWRYQRPIIDWGICTHCMLCWIYCPDSCFMVENSKLTGIDYDHCKGCGICAHECPVKAIILIDELEARKEEEK